MKRDLATLNPASQDLTRLTARLFLVHGRNDRLIPYPETVTLANAVGQERARVFLIHRGLGHVDLSLGHVRSGQFWRENVPDVWHVGRGCRSGVMNRARPPTLSSAGASPEPQISLAYRNATGPRSVRPRPARVNKLSPLSARVEREPTTMSGNGAGARSGN
jgi:hypothetical protein